MRNGRKSGLNRCMHSRACIGVGETTTCSILSNQLLRDRLPVKVRVQVRDRMSTRAVDDGSRVAVHVSDRQLGLGPLRKHDALVLVGDALHIDGSSIRCGW